MRGARGRDEKNGKKGREKERERKQRGEREVEEKGRGGLWNSERLGK